MEKKIKQESIIKYKLLFTAIVLLVYLIGKSIPLYMIDVSVYLHRSVDAETLLLQTISGDVHRCSIFALGISPFMIASIIAQVISSCRNSESKSKISPMKMNRLSLGMMFVIAVVQAVLRVDELHFRVTGDMLYFAKAVAAMELVAGAMIILWLASRNKKYGFGGQSALILVNILDGLGLTLKGQEFEALVLPLVICLVVIIVVMIMENTEIRIPVQRISVHNIYADKNYFAIKLNPIGVMPAMFSMAIFTLPQMIIKILLRFWPEQERILWFQENLVLTEPLGISFYIVILYVLSVGFSRVFINPKEITEQFLKSGDSIVNVHAGKDTKRYLSKVITRVSLVSATVMSICLGAPILLNLAGIIEPTFTTLPSSVMMLTGIFCNLYREFMAIKDLEAYKPFI